MSTHFLIFFEKYFRPKMDENGISPDRAITHIMCDKSPRLSIPENAVLRPEKLHPFCKWGYICILEDFFVQHKGRVNLPQSALSNRPPFSLPLKISHLLQLLTLFKPHLHFLNLHFRPFLNVFIKQHSRTACENSISAQKPWKNKFITLIVLYTCAPFAVEYGKYSRKILDFSRRYTII